MPPRVAAGADASIEIHPLTAGRWPDLERLFGSRGACGGCWCMTWRLTRRDYERRKGAANRRAFRALVDRGPPPGVLAYAIVDGRVEAVGWCAVAPRTEYPALGRSRILKPVDQRPVWAVTCLFVERSFRRRGMSVALLRAAAEFARVSGATILEGYPIEPKHETMPDVFAFTGLADAFRAAGFAEVARRSPTRPIMRLELHRSSRSR